jgi:dCTP deaminase
VDITDSSYELQPNEFILAQTLEIFNLPDNICAEFKLKSSGARTGLENALATWCDCGWHGSVLTLELKNFLRYHTLKLTAGMPIGQMIFYRVPMVPKERSYATIGRYNKDKSVQVVKL